MAGIMVQIAAHLGFREMYLLGCDMRQGPHVHGDDMPFVPEQGWQRYWTELRAQYSHVVDCTPGGRLNKEGVLEYVPLEEVLNG